ncbi:MAG: ATP-binding protein [Caldimonas sp.]
MTGPGTLVSIFLASLGAALAVVAVVLWRRQRTVSTALRKARARIAELEGESDSGSFGPLVSHDLRAPIRVVEGFTRIIKEDHAEAIGRIGVDHLDRVLGAAQRMNHMIDALLALSKLSSQPIERVPVDLSQLAGYIVDDLRRLAPERRVEVEIGPGMKTTGDPTLLRMVLENLLGNAWKYTGNTAAARIGFVRHPDEPATFTVRDNGAGFDMRYADRLFGAFQRLHSASEFPGTGIGLASVRRIVRRHGGEVRAEGEPGRGARFHFSLPPG